MTSSQLGTTGLELPCCAGRPSHCLPCHCHHIYDEGKTLSQAIKAILCDSVENKLTSSQICVMSSLLQHLQTDKQTIHRWRKGQIQGRPYEPVPLPHGLTLTSCTLLIATLAVIQTDYCSVVRITNKCRCSSSGALSNTEEAMTHQP